MMRQAVHIFRKDVRHLRWELALLLALFAWIVLKKPSGAFNYEGFVQFAMFPLVILALLLPGRVAHGEALPGDRQFWLTRPYSRKSLLLAKCVFLAVFVIAPVTVVDAIVVRNYGFAISQYIPGLLWEQILVGSVVIAPALALGTITRNAAGQILTALVLAAFFLFVYAVELEPFYSWSALDWVYDSIAAGLVVAGSAGIVLWQYFKRRTYEARIVFGAVAGVVALVTLLPVSMAMAVQRSMEHDVVNPSAIHVSLDSPIEQDVMEDSTTWLRMPLRVSGVPEGLRLWADQIQLNIRHDGPDWVGEFPERPEWLAVDHARALMLVRMSFGELNAIKNSPVRLRGRALMTVGANRRTEGLRSKGSKVPGLGVCVWQRAMQCDHPFRDTRSIVSFSEQNYMPSYSPFPAELMIGPIEKYSFRSDGRRLRDDTKVTMEDPVEHFFFDFDLGDIRLANYIIEPRNGTP